MATAAPMTGLDRLTASSKMRNLLLGAVAGGLSGWILAALNLNKDIAFGVVTPAITALPPLVSEVLTERKALHTSAAQDVMRGGIDRNPLWLSALLVLAIVAVERLFIVVVAASVAFTILAAVGKSSVSFGNAFGPATLVSYAAVPFMALATLFLAKYCAHRINRNREQWILGSLVVVVLIDVALAKITLKAADIDVPGHVYVALYLPMFLLLVGAALLGIVWSRRDHAAYLMRRLFRRVGRAEDRQALLELAQQQLVPQVAAQPTVPPPPARAKEPSSPFTV